MDITTIFVIIPLLIFQLGLMIYGIKDWRNQKEMPNRDIWLVIIILINIIGPILYFTLAPRDSAPIDVDEVNSW